MSKFQAPPIRTPFIGNPPEKSLGGQSEIKKVNVPSYAWMNWFQSVTNALSIPNAPATSSSAGTPGQRAFDANFEYVCIAKNTWKRIPLSAF